MPLGRRFSSMISPTGSGMAAICSQPWATVSMIAGVSLSRSSIGALRPAACAAATSFAFCGQKRRAVGTQPSRQRHSAASLAAVGAAAMAREAARAATPTWAM